MAYLKLLIKRLYLGKLYCRCLLKYWRHTYIQLELVHRGKINHLKHIGCVSP